MYISQKYKTYFFFHYTVLYAVTKVFAISVINHKCYRLIVEYSIINQYKRFHQGIIINFAKNLANFPHSNYNLIK